MKYKVNESYSASDKLVLIMGKGGNWSGHFCIGMPAACNCDVLIAISGNYPDNLQEIQQDIWQAGLNIRSKFVTYDENESDRIALYQKLEKENGKFSGVIDAENIDTVTVFEHEERQKEIHDKSDMKARYQMSGKDTLSGKKILILGAGGNWGGHMAIGMALAGKADLVLIDQDCKYEIMREIADSINGMVSVHIEIMNDLSDRYGILRVMQEKYGAFDSFMDMRGLNTD